jgi:hypothetical protein
MFTRSVLTDGLNGGLPKRASPGDGFHANVIVAPNATDANLTLAVTEMFGGAVQFTGFTAGRNVTTPTAAQILAAAPDMNIGDSFVIKVSVVPAFAATYVAGVGVTLLGRATTPASSVSDVVITRTGAATVSWRVL